MKFTTNRGRLIIVVSVTCGIIAMCLGGVLIGFFDEIVRYFMKKELTLKPGSEFFEIWKEIPIPIFQNIYIFNITNPYEFEQGAKPKLQELGPYVFKGRWYKEDMQWNDTDGTLTYNDRKDYTFVPELSAGSQDDLVFSLNGPLLAVINYVDEFAPFFLRSFIVEIMNDLFASYNETLLIHKSVRELVYEGYHEPMVADLTQVVESFITLPLKLVNDTFGILHERAHVGDGMFTIKSGFHSLDDYASIQKWNNKSAVNWWSHDECNALKGTDGVQYAPGVKRNYTLTLFNPNLCRTLPLTYERDITVHGIKTLRFGMAKHAFASSDINPDNKCYCHGTECRNGILPMNCKKGAPYVLSLPHFLEGEEELKNSVHGVEPIIDKHKTYVDVEPMTGFVLNAAFRVQLNGVVHSLPEYTVLQNVTSNILPVLWMSEEAQLDVYFANYFKTRVQTPILMFKIASIIAIVFGVTWILAALVFTFCIKTKVKPETLKHSVFLKTLNSVYTSVALWPPPEEEIKEANISEKTYL